MKAIVVFESMYGNTRQVADAVAEGLRWSMPTDVVPVGEVGSLDLAGVDLVVVGGPTHAWRMSSKRTRESAAQDSTKHPDRVLDAQPGGLGVREWLDEAKGNAGCRAVSFDTRLDKPKALTGSAARSIQRRLRTAGFAAFDKPHSFTVAGMAGPLSSGEIERAGRWGEAMGRQLVPLTGRKLMVSRAAR